jgi:Zn-dependent metalloprotease
MPRRTALIVVLALLAAACSSDDAAPDPDEASAGLIAAMQGSDRAQPEAWVERDGITTFVAPNFAAASDDAAEAALEYFAHFADAYGMSDPADRLSVTGIVDTAAGTVVRLDQSLGGLPVFGGDLAVAVAASTVTRVTGVIVPDADVAAPSLDAASAITAAVEAIPGDVLDDPSLVVVSPAIDGIPGDPVPAWELVVAGLEDGVPIDHLVLIDALDGRVLLVAALDLDAQDWDVYDAGNALKDGKSTLAEAELVFETRSGSTERHAEDDPTARAARDNMRATWEYFFATFGRDGHDDAGGLCRLYVHVGVKWRNATGNAECILRFGDDRPYAESIDVVAHEFTHAVTGQTAGLVYRGEPGALNEHYSDFFAAMVDASDWALFDIRDLSAPAVASTDQFVYTDRDNGGVHTNSGIPNMAGFLVANDGTATHPDSGVTVQGIGRAKAAQVWYATLLSLNSTTGFGAWACATASTADAMVGDLLTREEADSVRDALIAIGLLDATEMPCFWFTGTGILGGGGSGPDGATTTTVASSTTAPTTVPGACELVATWRLRDQEYLDQLAVLAEGNAGDFEYVSGEYRVDLRPDGTYVGIRDEWTIRVISEEGNLVFSIDGEDPGTWEADAEVLTLVDSGTGIAQISMWLEVGGQLVPLPFGGEATVGSEPFSGSGTYTCVGDVLTVTIELETGPLTATFDRMR